MLGGISTAEATRLATSFLGVDSQDFRGHFLSIPERGIPARDCGFVDAHSGLALGRAVSSLFHLRITKLNNRYNTQRSP